MHYVVGVGERDVGVGREGDERGARRGRIKEDDGWQGCCCCCDECAACAVQLTTAKFRFIAVQGWQHCYW